MNDLQLYCWSFKQFLDKPAARILEVIAKQLAGDRKQNDYFIPTSEPELVIEANRGVVEKVRN